MTTEDRILAIATVIVAVGVLVTLVWITAAAFSIAPLVGIGVLVFDAFMVWATLDALRN